MSTPAKISLLSQLAAVQRVSGLPGDALRRAGAVRTTSEALLLRDHIAAAANTLAWLAANEAAVRAAVKGEG